MDNHRAEVKRSRRITIVLAILAVTCVLMFIYGFLQGKEAEKQRALAAEQQMEAQRQRDRAIQLQKVAESEKIRAEQNRMLAEENRKKAEQALADCQKKNK